MVSKAQKVRLGVFLVVGFALLLTLVGVVAGNQLVEKWDKYTIKYEEVSVNGLNIGGQVKYNGILLGRVDDISIDEKDIRKIVVSISIKDGTPIKADMEATLVPVGITGLKQIEIRGGTNQSRLLKPGDSINPGVSAFDNITGKAEVIAEKMEVLLNNLNRITSDENQRRVSNILVSVDTILDQNRGRVRSIVANADSLVSDSRRMIRRADHTIAAVEAIVKSEEMKGIVSNTHTFSQSLAKSDIATLTEDLNQAINRANLVLRNLNFLIESSHRDISTTVEYLRETMEYLSEFARELEEDPTILIRGKRN